MSKPAVAKLALLALMAGAAAAAWPLLAPYLSLDAIKSQKDSFALYYEQNGAAVLAGYFMLYVFVAALSLPGAAIMTLLAGALFGFWAGLALVSFASSLGATAAFVAARFLLGDAVQKKYGDKLAKINEGVEREGVFYLFALRLIPLFPFFLVNLLMALTTIRVFSFYWASQLGMLPGTAAYIYAGAELAKIKSLGDVASPQLLAAFAVLGLMPFAAKKLVAFLRARRGKQKTNA